MTATTAAAWTAGLRDRRLPQVEELFTEGIPAPLEAAIAASDGEIRSLKRVAVGWWPRKSCTVQWEVDVVGGPLEGRARYVATTLDAPEGGVVVGDGDHHLTIWRVPDDPFLPALRAALDPGVATSIVEDLGGELRDASTRLRAYRPTRRAVIEVLGSGHRLYFKLVKPKRLEALYRRHADLYGILPVPEPLGISKDLGLLVMPTMQGTTLREVLEDPTQPLPDPAVVTQLRDHIPELDFMTKTASSIETLPTQAALLATLLPDQAGRIQGIVDEIGDDEGGGLVPVHGDFHEAQLMCGDGQIIGVLDVDTVGLGHPADDAAVMIAHLFLWATLSSQRARVIDYATRLLAQWDAVLDPVDLRKRVAARLMGLASGPFRAQADDWPIQVSLRIDLAAAWVQSARDAAGS